MRVLVTGATGTIGRRVVIGLCAGGHGVRATSRTPTTAGLPDGVEVVGSAGPVAALIDGADAILVVPAALGAEAALRLSEFLAAAPDVHVVLLSSASAGDPASPTGARHRPLEELVAAHDGPWSVLRSVPFALNTAHWWAGTIRAARFADAPYPDVATAPVDERDVADALVPALLGVATGSVRTLTGPQPLTAREQLAEIGAQLGAAIDVREIAPDEVRRRLTSAGVPAWSVDGLLRSFEYASEHGPTVTDAVSTLTGRPARTYGEWVADHLAVFR